jgi:FlaA1/EpsC-like NDP-sugar epimerase
VKAAADHRAAHHTTGLRAANSGGRRTLEANKRNAAAGPGPGPQQPAWWQTLADHRVAVQAVVDMLAWTFALPVATLLRYEFSLTPGAGGGLVLLVPFAMAAQGVVGVAAGQYRGRWRYGSFDEVAALVRTVAVVTTLVAVVNRLLLPERIPVGATIGAGLLAVLVQAGARYTWRLVLERRMRPTGEGATRVVVFGAGEAGDQLLTAMMRNPSSPLFPVALLDDDPSKANLRLRGVPVQGGRSEVVEVAQRHQAAGLVVAVPSADAALIRELTAQADQIDLSVMVLPSVGELLGARVGISDVRPVTEDDLLGRHAVDTDVEAIAGYLTGRRVLVTGAGGSIGAELCRQIWTYAPAALVMLDRDESSLHAIQLAIEGRALLDSRNLVVADIRDQRRLADVFAEHRPEVVFHTAALKHLPLLELYPGEAVKTNVVGTKLLLEAAQEAAVERFVNISTDKAADPISVLGYSKRIAERFTAAVGEQNPGYISVRFGNVLGSRGSVLTSFRAQIDAGGPVTVTHGSATRFFMTVQEAVQLVIQAGALGGRGEALVLDMGEPVSIMEVAHRLVGAAEHPVDIVQTGLRPGEKVHEVLVGRGETALPTSHAAITQVGVPALDLDATAAIDPHAPVEVVTEALRGFAHSDAPARGAVES